MQSELELSENPLVGDKLSPRGKFKLEIVRVNGDKEYYDIDNMITNEGRNKLLEIMFYTLAKISTWYIGLVNNAGFGTFAAADTMSSHAGWTEFTGYSGSTRPQWVTVAPSGQSIQNSTPTTFTINTSGVLHGIFISSGNSGTTGILWSTAAFSANITVNNGDQVNVVYIVTD